MIEDQTAYKDYFKTHYKYDSYQEGVDSYQKWFHGQWKFMETKVDIATSAKFLEVGSGAGGFYGLIKKAGYNVKQYTGLELDVDATEFANQHYQVECFKNVSLEKFSSEGFFDFVFAFEVLEHLSDPLSDLNKISNLLGSNGTLVATSPFPFKKNILADKTHLFVLHPENWKRLLHMAGFSEVSLYPMSFIPYLWRLDKRINRVVPIYIPFSNWISTCLIIARK